MNDASPAESIAGILAQELSDDMVVCTGVNSMVPLAACMLARLTHAPRLTVLAGGIFVNPSRLVPEFCAGWDPRAEHVADMSDLFAITELGIDAVFFSGMQLDQFGNVNMHHVELPDGTSRRGPGVANTSFGHTAKKVLLWTERHELRQLRSRVDFHSIVGHELRGSSRAELGLAGHGPQLLLTPQVKFRPDVSGVMKPVARTGSMDWVEVEERTGWELGEEPQTRESISRDELRVLREFVDLRGWLRSEKQ